MTQELEISLRSPSTDRTKHLRGDIYRVCFPLSVTPPSEWAEIFNEAWDSHLYSMKRRAKVIGDAIFLDCVPDEIERDHLRELQKVIDKTNTHYSRQYAGERRQQARAEQERERRNQRMIDILSKIHLDDED